MIFTTLRRGFHSAAQDCPLGEATPRDRDISKRRVNRPAFSFVANRKARIYLSSFLTLWRAFFFAANPARAIIARGRNLGMVN